MYEENCINFQVVEVNSVIGGLYSIKKLDDGRYEVDVRPQGAEENVSGGNLKLKVKLKHSNVSTG